MKTSIISIISSILSISSPNPKFSEVCDKPKMVTCDSTRPCPIGSKCIIIYGKAGLCVLTDN